MSIQLTLVLEAIYRLEMGRSPYDIAIKRMRGLYYKVSNGRELTPWETSLLEYLQERRTASSSGEEALSRLLEAPKQP